MILNVTAVLNFFSPQYEFGFWSWAIGCVFLALGLAVASCSKSSFLRFVTPFFGLLLFIDETQQAHECFAEHFRLSPLYYIIGEILLVVPFSIFWFLENHPKKGNHKLLVFGGVSFLVATVLRFSQAPGNFKIIEELAEFAVAISALIYVVKSKDVKFHKASLSVWFFLVILIFWRSSAIRAEICPRVEYWAGVLSHF